MVIERKHAARRLMTPGEDEVCVQASGDYLHAFFRVDHLDLEYATVAWLNGRLKNSLSEIGLLLQPKETRIENGWIAEIACFPMEGSQEWYLEYESGRLIKLIMDVIYIPF